MAASMKPPKNISPQGKKAMLSANPHDRVVAMVELAPDASPDKLTAELARVHATLKSWSPASRIMNVEIDAAEIENLAKIWQVNYVDIGGRFSR